MSSPTPGQPAPISLTSRAGAARLRGASDRRLTLFAITIAAGYLALAILSVITPVAAVHGTWLPLHLLLAGAASTAMAGVMPFFSAESSWVSNQSSMVTGVPEKASPSD